MRYKRIQRDVKRLLGCVKVDEDGVVKMPSRRSLLGLAWAAVGENVMLPAAVLMMPVEVEPKAKAMLIVWPVALAELLTISPKTVRAVPFPEDPALAASV